MEKRINWKVAVYQNAKRASDKRRKADRASGKFWEENVKFNQDLTLPQSFNLNWLLEQLEIAGYNRKQKRMDVHILLANLYAIGKRKPIAISMSPNSYVRNRYVRVRPYIIKLIKQLEKMKMIEVKKGFYYEEEKSFRLTRICATEKLLKSCPLYRIELELNPKELVILHDENKKEKEYKDTAKTCRIRKKLEKANKVNGEADIQFDDTKLNIILKAFFVRKFTWYGRLHTIGTRHVQAMSGLEREEITINGNSVVELDFNGLHPTLLYAAEGIQFDIDPYNIIDDRLGIVRVYMKVLLLRMINAENWTKAEKAGNNWLYKHHREREELKKLGITRARPLMEKFMKVHESINHYFCQGKDTGMRLMNKDAMIALDVVDHFISQGIPIIPIHDSFIVEEQHENELREVMQGIYKKHTGGFKIRIK